MCLRLIIPQYIAIAIVIVIVMIVMLFIFQQSVAAVPGPRQSHQGEDPIINIMERSAPNTLSIS